MRQLCSASDKQPALLWCSDQHDKRLKHFHMELDDMLYGDSESNDYAKGILKVCLCTATFAA